MLNILMIIYSLLFFVLFLFAFYFYGIHWILLFLILSFIIYYYFEKFEKSKPNIFFSLIKLLLVLVIPIYCLVCCFVVFFANEISSNSSKLTYPIAIKHLQAIYDDTIFDYFPQHIPFISFNYKCSFSKSFFGDGSDYILSFKTTKNYINKVIKSNNASISIPKKTDKCEDRYCSSHYSYTGIPIDHDVYLLSGKSSCYACKLGFAVNENTNSVYFFFFNHY